MGQAVAVTVTVTVAAFAHVGVELAVGTCVIEPAALVVAAEAEVTVALVCPPECATPFMEVPEAVVGAADVRCKSTPVWLAVAEPVALVAALVSAPEAGEVVVGPAMVETAEEVKDAAIDVGAEADEVAAAVVALAPVP